MAPKTKSYIQNILLSVSPFAVVAMIFAGAYWKKGIEDNQSEMKNAQTEIKQTLKEHAKDDDMAKETLKDAVSEISTSMKVFEVKLDYGKQYSEQLKDSIAKLRRHKK